MLIGYARISKADGSQSLDLQRDALREAGVSDDAIYEDQASGQREDRPGLAAFLKAARPGDVIVVWRLDRLGRNLRHLVNLVQDLNDRDIGIRVLAGQGASIDTTTASGKSVFALFAALAEFERELIRERTLAGLASARARGRKGGRPHALSKAQVRLAQAAMAQRDTKVSELCLELGVTKGDDLPLRSARWFLEKPRATGPGSLGGPKSGPLTCDFAPLLSEPLFHLNQHHCLKVLLIESTLQYRFATPNPLKTRWVGNRCVIARLCNLHSSTGDARASSWTSLDIHPANASRTRSGRARFCPSSTALDRSGRRRRAGVTP